MCFDRIQVKGVLIHSKVSDFSICQLSTWLMAGQLRRNNYRTFDSISFVISSMKSFLNLHKENNMRYTFSIFRSFNLEFPSIYYQIKTRVRLQNRQNCLGTIVSIGLGGKWRHIETGTNTGICYAIITLTSWL